MARPASSARPSATSRAAASAPLVPTAGRFGVYRPTLDRLVYGLSLVGLIVVSHLAFQAAQGFAAGCSGFDPNNLDAAPSGCASALASTYATVGGISNTTLGLVFYGIVALLSAAMVVAPDMLATFKRLRAGIILIGAVYAIYLVFILLTGEAGGLCWLCLTSHAITLAMAALVLYDATRR